MNISSKLGIMIMALFIMALPLLAACNSDDDTGTSTATPTSKPSIEDEVENVIDLADIPDGRIYQRDNNNQYDLLIEGTYSGNPASIEARIITDGSLEEVLPWTMIDDSPNDEAFSGILEDIPQGGWYNIQVRATDDPSVMDAGTSKFGVGVLVVCAGQSHIDFWFWVNEICIEEWDNYVASDADEMTRMYRHEQVLQQGPAWDGWQSVSGVGATVFANKLREVLGVPVGLLDYGVGGSALWQRNTADVAALGLQDFVPAMGWWVPDDSNTAPEENNYAVLKAGLDTIDNRVEAVLWIQGHTDTGVGESTAGYKTGLTELFTRMRTDTRIADLPIFISQVTRMGPFEWEIEDGMSMTIPPASDENVQNIRDAEVQYCAEDQNTYLGCIAIDLPLCCDGVHHSPLGQQLQAERLAQAVLHVLRNSDDHTYHRGPQLASYEIMDSSTIDVHITHVSGNDFTPASGIKGFEVMIGENTVVPESAERYDANTIRLTINGETSGTTGIRYLYGINPGDLDIHLYAGSYIHDNSPLQLPLEGGVLP